MASPSTIWSYPRPFLASKANIGHQKRLFNRLKHDTYCKQKKSQYFYQLFDSLLQTYFESLAEALHFNTKQGNYIYTYLEKSTKKAPMA
ncbi:hypothetical protein CGK58_00160 [Vibrio parahaemolyticus]|nr:hypothetical protein BUN10_22045 [Vibrio parahaemolyticus]TNZ17614.1 hypothetical protein CGK58_00160 [Vibrio parahaemolyticus]